jgi:hypothetical protein
MSAPYDPLAIPKRHWQGYGWLFGYNPMFSRTEIDAMHFGFLAQSMALRYGRTALGWTKNSDGLCVNIRCQCARKLSRCSATRAMASRVALQSRRSAPGPWRLTCTSGLHTGCTPWTAPRP